MPATVSILNPDSLIRARAIKGSIVLAFISGFAFSQNLWFNEGRFFPLVKPFNSLPVLPAPFDALLLALFVSAAFAWVFYEKRIVGCIALTAIVIILLQDQMRWQPWAYLYTLLLLPYLLVGNHPEKYRSILLCQQCIIAGVYFYSGLHKLNSNFIDNTFVEMLKETGADAGKWKMAGYAIPIIEAAIGLGLLINKTRMTAVYFAIATHFTILFYLIPMVMDHNTVVYPWNMAMIILICLLFLQTSNHSIKSVYSMPQQLMVPVILVWVLPVLNFYGYLDHYLSFSLYSNKASSFYIAVEKSEMHKIDKRHTHHFAEVQGLQGGQLINLDKWAYADLNVPFYPELRTFKQVCQNFCGLGIDNNKLVFLEMTIVNGKPHFNTFTCKNLNSP